MLLLTLDRAALEVENGRAGFAGVHNRPFDVSLKWAHFHTLGHNLERPPLIDFRLACTWFARCSLSDQMAILGALRSSGRSILACSA